MIPAYLKKLKTSFCNRSIFCYPIVMKKFNLALTFVGVFAIQITSGSADTFSSYDDIVKELSSSRYEAKSATQPEQEVIRFHAGIGFVTSRVSLDLPAQYPGIYTLSGYEARLGIDLFSPRWIAEGAVRSYNPEIFSGTELSLKEFDLMVNYRWPAARKIDLTFGGGMAARYLDFKGTIPAATLESYITPSSLFASSLILNVSSHINLGLAISYRNPLIDETVDNGSLDGAFRLSGQF